MQKLKASVVTIALLCSGCMIVPPPPPVQPPVSTRDEIRVFADLVNQHRVRVGCKPLIWHVATAEVAQRHSQDMNDRQFFAHTNPSGLDPFQRLKAAGISYHMAAENIAEGQRSAEQVLQSWLSSRGHRRNIENCSLKDHGVGLANFRWTHMFVTLR